MIIQSNLQHEYHTPATRVQHECSTSAAQTTLVQQEHYTNETSAILVNNCDFDNDTSHPNIYYMANERLQGGEQFHPQKYLSEIPHSHTEMCLKNAPQKLDFLMAKDILKNYTLDSSCTLLPLHIATQLRIVTQPRFR